MFFKGKIHSKTETYDVFGPNLFYETPTATNVIQFNQRETLVPMILKIALYLDKGKQANRAKKRPYLLLPLRVHEILNHARKQPEKVHNIHTLYLF